MIQQLSSDSFDAALGSSPEVHAVRFWAKWCGPCHAMSPIFNAVAQEMESSVQFGEVDIDASPDVASRYSVQTIPTVLLFKNGELIDRMGGAATKAKLTSFINRHLS